MITVPLAALLAVETAGFCRASVCTTSPAAFPALTGEVGVLVSGYSYSGGRRGDGFLTFGAGGRYRPERHGRLVDRLLVEGALGFAAPVARDTGAIGLVATLRAGMALERVAFTMGVQPRLDATEAPFSILPSATCEIRRGALAASLGILDRPMGPIAHLAFEYAGFGIGYAALKGVEAFGRFALGEGVGLEVRGFAAQVLHTFSVGLSVGFIWGEGAVFRLRRRG